MDTETDIVVFAYNFKHRKTQDFLLRLFLDGYRVSHVIAADPVKLSIPKSSIRSKVKHTGLVEPRTVAEAIGAEYHVFKHKGEEIEAFLEEIKPAVGVISGARILGRPVIEKFSTGIINFHPGLIPEARGLDALLWSVRNDVPLGVTSHLIDHRVDAGKILEVRKIPIFADDELFDLSERLYEIQLDMLDQAIKAAVAGEYSEDKVEGEYNRKMEGELEKDTLGLLPAYIQKHSG